MSDFLLFSIVASVLLTVLLNLVPLVFPKSSEKIERKVQQKLNESIERKANGDRPKVQVFFPWKAMLLISIGLTILVNVIGWLSSTGQ